MYLCAVFQEVFIAGLQPCVTKLELKGTLITHDAGCVLIAGLTILAACGRTDTRRGSGGTHWDYLTSELTRRSVRLLISRRLRRRLVLETDKSPSINYCCRPYASISPAAYAQSNCDQMSKAEQPWKLWVQMRGKRCWFLVMRVTP